MSTFAVAYPDNVPFDSVREVVRIVKDGKVADERAAFGQHLWIVQGYVQSQVLGDGAAQQPNVVGAASPAPKLLEAEAVQYLETIGNFNPQFAAGLNIPWKQLLSYLLKIAADELAKS